MLCGYNTNGLQNHRLGDALRLLADFGYEAVGLTLDVQHLDPFRVAAREIADCAALLESLQLTPVIETGARYLLDPREKHEPTLMTRDAASRRTRVEFYARAAAIGRDLGAEVVSFWSGIDRAPDSDSEAWMHEGGCWLPARSVPAGSSQPSNQSLGWRSAAWLTTSACARQWAQRLLG